VRRAQEQTFGVDAAELERVLEAEPLIVGVVLIHTYGVPARDTWKTLELAQKFNVW
jgi:dTDP-4-amino-4,6-dideoxygalactose transaminase